MIPFGRTTTTIENHVNGTVSDSVDKTVVYTNGTNNQMATLGSDVTSGGGKVITDGAPPSDQSAVNYP